jgi:hypothetical protein
MPAIDLPIEAIRHAGADPTFRAAVEALYAELDAEIAGRLPLCINRGHCCRFEQYGHRLYVTSVELAYFAATADGTQRPADADSDCPYHEGGVCTARTSRPAGCRIFFCDPAAADWQAPVTERVLRRLRALGEQFGLPYAYVEWRSALRALTGTEAG